MVTDTLICMYSGVYIYVYAFSICRKNKLHNPRTTVIFFHVLRTTTKPMLVFLVRAPGCVELTFGFAGVLDTAAGNARLHAATGPRLEEDGRVR